MTQQTNDELRRRFEVWERHGQTIMLTVTLAALTFTGNFMWSVNTRLTEMQTRNDHLTQSVAELKGQLSSMQLNYITRPEFSEYLSRLRSLEENERRSK